MLGRIRAALERHHRAVVTAEALVWRHGSRGVAMAHPVLAAFFEGRSHKGTLELLAG